MSGNNANLEYLAKLAKYWSDIEYARRFGVQTFSGGQSPPPPPPPPREVEENG
jgi:hypothetical protein